MADVNAGIEAISKDQMLALRFDGRTVPITALLDEFGDETDDWTSAEVFVAGDDRDGWFAESVAAFLPVMVQ